MLEYIQVYITYIGLHAYRVKRIFLLNQPRNTVFTLEISFQKSASFFWVVVGFKFVRIHPISIFT